MPPRMLERSVLKGYTSFREIDSDEATLWSAVLPELARFFGIIIRMYVEPGAPHHVPHFHVYYQNYAAVYGIDPIERISGELPRRQQRLVEAWAELHQGELRESWERLQAGQAPHKIAPLH